MKIESLTILIIDDSPDDYDLYQRLLQKIQSYHYRSDWAHSGVQAMEMLKTTSFDCVLIDYSLPGANGVEVLKTINTHYPQIPLVFLTGQGNEAVAVEALKCGATDYLTKSSLQKERLHETIIHAIQKQAANHKNPPSSTYTILIVDDNPDDREHYYRSLKKVPGAQYLCLDADHGKKGVEIATEKSVDCVLLDYSLPGMNGLEVLKNLRAEQPFLPIILLTGQGNETVAVEAIKHGAHDYLTKSSVTPERLNQAIKAAIDASAMLRRIAEKDSQLTKKTTELALSEERYQLAVQALSVGIWDWDITTNRLYYSPRFREIIRSSDDELSDYVNVWKTRMHPDDRDSVLEMLDNHLKKNGAYDVQYRLCLQDGTSAWIRAKGQAVWDMHGNPVRMVGSFEDISWQKEAEAEREKMIAKLTESNSELERFAYACSHDLQEPLRMISNFSERLEKHLGAAFDDKARHYMKYIIDGAAQARQLINDVLNYARVDHETERLNTVESEKTLQGVLRDLSTRLEETGARVTHDPLPEVCMQPTHLRQLLQNLISNALKFCTEKPQVHIGAEQEGMMWRFWVRDNGIGIAPDHMQKIFVVFQRLHSRERYPGSGIGLALCKKLVQKYGGRLWVESEVGKGSVFYFTLPSASKQQHQAA